MANPSREKRSIVRNWIVLTGVLFLGIAIGGLSDWPAETNAQTRDANSKGPKAFLSGSERSVIVLKEISTTLKTIDQRVVKIEKSVAAMEKRLATGVQK